MRIILLACQALLFTAWPTLAADLTIHTDQPGISVSPTLYGLFFEDINRSGDGGVYGEMLQNRSFEDNQALVAWTPLQNPQNPQAQATFELDQTTPLNAHHPTSLKITVQNPGGGRVGLFNQGFKGIPGDKTPNTSPEWLAKFQAAQNRPGNGLAVQGGKEYLLSLYARAQHFAGPLTVSLETQKGVVLDQKAIPGLGATWEKFSVSLHPSQTDPDARLVLSTDQTGIIRLDLVSLFPKDTYLGRPGGLRADLVNMMAGLHPGLMRFPGGSYSEAAHLADAWRWKETLGDVAERPGNWNIWGYRSTCGLGFHEYLQLAEDLGAEPLFVAHVGMSERDFVPMDQLEPWIQDVLDAIEYANGPVTSKWGALRAKAGHPQSFHLKYVEIGNENGMGYAWGGGNRHDYLPRYQAFYDRIKKLHPEIVTIANIHTLPDAPADVVDEHYYNASDWFFKAATLYDHYDRSGPKIYVGEYAAKPDGGHGNLREALAEAAFMTGLERNSDVVLMSSYAPLFTNPTWEKWHPDAITFDNTRVYGSPSYYVQALFAANRADVIVPVDLPASTTPEPTLFAVAGLKKGSGDLILKVVNSAAAPVTTDLHLAGLVGGSFTGGMAAELTSPSLSDENSFDHPVKIAPRTRPLPPGGAAMQHTFPPYSVTILRWTRK